MAKLTPACEVQYYVALTDVTPNRGTIAFYGRDEGDAREAAGEEGLVLREHPQSCEAMLPGARAYHDGELAWRTQGY